MTTSDAQFDRTLERITAHLRAHVAEARRLERAGAGAGEIEERRALIARLQDHLAGLVKNALSPGPAVAGPLARRTRPI
jgi:hypothetical protein